MSYEEEWSSDANEAVQISIVQAGNEDPITLSSFHPRFTYPIFGDEERIFGYQGLKINIRFAAHDGFPNAEVTWDKKFTPVGGTQATDIEEVLSEWMPASSFNGIKAFNSQLQSDDSAIDFTPPGELIENYTSKGRQFEIWLGELIDPEVQSLVDRFQILISFFIEGGTPLTLDDADWTLARWRVFFVYERLPNPPNGIASVYSIVGYSTSYRFLTYVPTGRPIDPLEPLTQDQMETFALPFPEPISPASLPCRARISQFMILPSHQRHSHGAHLYAAMTKIFLGSPECTEITVEDPNEAFDDLRDYCDYTRLLANGTLDQIKLFTDIDPKLTANKVGVRVPTSSLVDVVLLKNLRLKNKLAPRQFYRLVEMHLLSQIPAHTRQAGPARLTQRAKSKNKDDRALYYWRLLVKQRVYKKNKDVLMQLDHLDRIDKVEHTVAEIQGDYERLMAAMVEKATNGEIALDEGPSTSANVPVRPRARKPVIIDLSEDEDEDIGGVPVPVPVDPPSDERKRKREVVLISDDDMFDDGGGVAVDGDGDEERKRKKSKEA